jgi:hypothetical protein
MDAKSIFCLFHMESLKNHNLKTTIFLKTNNLQIQNFFILKVIFGCIHDWDIKKE